MKNMSFSMKTVVCLTALIICFASLTGCGGSSGYKKSDSTTDKMDAVVYELKQAQSQIDITVEALNQVVAKANQDPRAEYEAFAKALKDTEAQAKKVSKRADEMRKQGQAYFKAWEEEFEKIASEDLKKRFEQRKAMVEAKYAEISKVSQQLKTEYESFMSDVTDIQTVLSIDLTSANIAGIADIVEKVTAEAKTINMLIDKHVAALDMVSAEMRPSVAEQQD